MAPAADAKVFSAQATVADAPHPTQFTAALHSRSTSGSNAEAHVHEAVGFDTPATPLLHCAVDELLGVRLPYRQGTASQKSIRIPESSTRILALTASETLQEGYRPYRGLSTSASLPVQL